MLLQTMQVEDIGHAALKLIEMLQLGKLDKGAVFDAKYKMLIGCWFSAKKTSTEMVSGDTNGGKIVDGSVYICQDTIITLDAVNRDKAVVEYYRVLGLYNKHCNKWYMEVADEVLWDHNKPKAMKAWRIMASMLRRVGTEGFEDV